MEPLSRTVTGLWGGRQIQVQMTKEDKDARWWNLDLDSRTRTGRLRVRDEDEARWILTSADRPDGAMEEALETILGREDGARRGRAIVLGQGANAIYRTVYRRIDLGSEPQSRAEQVSWNGSRAAQLLEILDAGPKGIIANPEQAAHEMLDEALREIERERDRRNLRRLREHLNRDDAGSVRDWVGRTGERGTCRRVHDTMVTVWGEDPGEGEDGAYRMSHAIEAWEAKWGDGGRAAKDLVDEAIEIVCEEMGVEIWPGQEQRERVQRRVEGLATRGTKALDRHYTRVCRNITIAGLGVRRCSRGRFAMLTEELALLDKHLRQHEDENEVERKDRAPCNHTERS